mgnify:CR=1 FL=1
MAGMIYILTSAQSFVLGRKSPFSFELRLLRGGEKNEGIIGGDRGGDPLHDLILGHILNGRLGGLISYRSLTPLRLE